VNSGPAYLKNLLLDEEIILRIVRPHIFFLAKYFFRALLIAVLAFLFSKFFMETALQREHDFLFSPFLALLFFVMVFWLGYEEYANRLLVITNLRIIRISKSLVSYPNKRSMFLKEIGKLKTLPYPIVSSILGIGKIVLVPATSTLGDIEFDWTPDFESVCHSIEELIFKFKVADQTAGNVDTSRSAI